MKRACLVLALVGLLAVGTVPAAAHPFVAASDPGPGETLSEGDRVIVLQFGEAVDPSSLDVEVTDGSGENLVRSVSVADDRRTVRVTTEPLSEGRYDVSWTATSTDGHPGTGELTVAVGAGESEASASWSDIPGGTPALVGETLARWALLVGGVVGLGVAIVAGAVEGRRTRGPWRATLAGALAFSLAGGVGIVAALTYRQGDFATMADSTGGSIQLLVVGLLACSLGAAIVARRSSRDRLAPLAAAGGLALAAMAADSVASHGQAGASAAGIDGAWVMLVGLVHVVAAAIWVGCLVVLGLTIRSESAEAAVPLARRLSPWAAGAVVAIGVSGVFYADAHLLRWSDLLTTRYGGLLLAKAAIIVVPLAFAAYHRFRIMPAASGDRSGRFQRTVQLEAAFLVTIILLAALLGAHPRPAHPVESGDLNRGLEHTVESDGYRLSLVTPDPPSTAADRPVTLSVSSQSLPGLSMPTPTVSVESPAGRTRSVSLEETGDTTWRLPDRVLSTPGEWTVIARVDGPHGPVRASWTITVAEDGGADA